MSMTITSFDALKKRFSARTLLNFCLVNDYRGTDEEPAEGILVDRAEMLRLTHLEENLALLNEDGTLKQAAGPENQPSDPCIF